MLDSKFLSLSVSKKKLKHFVGFQNSYGPSALWMSQSCLSCAVWRSSMPEQVWGSRGTAFVNLGLLL